MHPTVERAVQAVGFVTFTATVVFCAVVGLSWLAAYVLWLCGSSAPLVGRVARSVRFLLKNPPTAALASLLLVSLALLLFFRPIYDFLHNVESIGPARRRSRTGRRAMRGREED